MTPAFRLESAWHANEAADGRFEFTLFNLGTEPVEGFTLSYAAMTRVVNPSATANATLLRRDANHHAFAAPDALSLAPGGCWRFGVGGLHRPARHVTDGPTAAYLTTPDGVHHPVAVSDLFLEGRISEPPPVLLPEGRLDIPVALQPWPRRIEVSTRDGFPVMLYPAKDTAAADLRALDAVLGLFQRLFPVEHAPFSLIANSQGCAIVFDVDPNLPPEGSRIAFEADAIRLVSADAAGRQNGLVSLAQMLRGARRDPRRFRFPLAGAIEDAPHHGWRGCHLDVSRQFFPMADVTRLLDILAWLKLNVFHWHLTDDEAWRLEILGYPELTTTGVLRGPDAPLLPQLGHGAVPVDGFYSQDDVRAVVAHAAALHIDVVPEIDIPGHNAATLVAIPDLRDGQEAPESYHSVQGYANNALNPAMPLTYSFLEAVIEQMALLFPSRYVHIGGDEVAKGAWLHSPKARELMEREGLAGTFELQSHFLRKVKGMLDARGKVLVGWNEVAQGGGVEPSNTLLMAWERPEVGIALAEAGYDVVMTPGQAYYLDMVQDEAWQEPGASWAGTVPPEHTYGYDAEGAFPAALSGRMKGVQACIWTEYVRTRDHFNRLVFPRLSAVAEAAWTPPEAKDWLRFCAISALGPTL